MAYALVALGFVLALNAAGAVNFAHGDLVVLGGAVAVLLAAWTGLPGILLLPLVALSLALAGVLAGVAGFLLGHQFLVTPTQGAGHMLKAYIAVALGGWGSVPGALVGALAIGGFETFVSAQVGDAWASAALYVAVLLVLTLRPRGLFGEPVGQRA